MATALMLVAVFLSFGAAPLHTVFAHSDGDADCADAADTCHAEIALPGISPHPLDHCFDQEFHAACVFCTTLSQSNRNGLSPVSTTPAAALLCAGIAACHAASHPAPLSGADLTRGPPVA